MTDDTRPQLNADAFGDGPIAGVARALYTATATRPLGPWWETPAALVPYLKWVYGIVGDPLDIESTVHTVPQPLHDTGTCVVGYSGGKDSLAAALLARQAGYHVVLYHVHGLNRAWPDELRYATESARIAGLPLVVERVRPRGTKAGVPEPVAKNQIIVAAMVEWARRHGRGPAFSMGMVRGDLQGAAHPLSYVHDTVDSQALFDDYLRAAAPGYRFELYLRGIAESNAVVAGYPDRRLLHAAHGCMAQMRFRPGYRTAAERKYGVRLLPGRCGVSCPKCSSEYILLAQLGALEPAEYSDEMFRAARKYLGAHPLYDASARPDLAGLDPEELADKYLEPGLVAELARPRGTWPRLCAGCGGPVLAHHAVRENGDHYDCAEVL